MPIFNILKNEYDYGQERNLFSFGEFLIKQGNLNEVEKYYRRLADELSHHPDHIIQCYNTLGKLAKDQSNYESRSGSFALLTPQQVGNFYSLFSFVNGSKTETSKNVPTPQVSFLGDILMGLVSSKNLTNSYPAERINYQEIVPFEITQIFGKSKIEENISYYLGILHFLNSPHANIPLKEKLFTHFLSGQDFILALLNSEKIPRQELNALLFQILTNSDLVSQNILTSLKKTSRTTGVDRQVKIFLASFKDWLLLQKENSASRISKVQSERLIKEIETMLRPRIWGVPSSILHGIFIRFGG